MPLTQTEGIVLKTHALGDTSRIVAIYSRDFGLIKLVAKGARKTPSLFGYSLEPLTRARYLIYYKPNGDLHLLSQADTLAANGSRMTDLVRLAHAEAARAVWTCVVRPMARAIAPVTRRRGILRDGSAGRESGGAMIASWAIWAAGESDVGLRTSVR